jgi:hypothetical protein
MMFPFAQTNVGASKHEFTLARVPSEKQELKLARSPCDSGSITNYRAPIIRKSRGKMSASPLRFLDEADDDCENRTKTPMSRRGLRFAPHATAALRRKGG